MKNAVVYIALAFMIITGCIFLYKSATIKPEVVTITDGKPVPTGDTERLKDIVDNNGNTQNIFKHSKDNVITWDDVKDKEQSLGFVDTAALALGLARKEILAVRRQLSTTKDSLLKAKVVITALNKKVYSYSDKYVAITYTPSDSTDTANVGTFDFSYNNWVTVTDYTKRNKVIGLPIGKKVSYTAIKSEDPRTVINGYKSLTLQRQEPFFGLRGQATATYLPEINSVGVGGGLRIELGRLSMKGNYLYYPTRQRWMPNFTADYDIIRL